MDINTLLKIWAAIFPILCIVVGWIFNAIQDLRQRTQKLEDVHGITIETIKNDLEEAKEQIKVLIDEVKKMGEQIHKHKNEESALVTSTNAVLKYLQKLEKNEQ